MNGGGYEGRGSFYREFYFWRVLLDCAGELEFCSREGLVQGAPICWGFWARGPGFLLVSWS